MIESDRDDVTRKLAVAGDKTLLAYKWSCIFIALFQSTDSLKCFTIHATFTHSHTHSYTGGRGGHARWQLLIRSNLGYAAGGGRVNPNPNPRQPALPTEPQPPHKIYKMNFIAIA